MTGDWGDLQLSRTLLRETFTVTEAGGGSRTLDLDGQESYPPLTRAQVIGRHDNINALENDSPIAVTFTDKPERNGYYQVKSASSTLKDYRGETLTAVWKVSLTRLGSAGEVDLQSRLTGAIRVNDFSLTGERWHAPPVGHYGYFTGSTNASTMTRAGADGTITIYRSVPANISPRWGCAPTAYLAGRARVNDTTSASANIELEGVGRTVPVTAWSLGNGLVNVTPTASAGVLDIQAYTGGAWRSKPWNVTIAASAVAAWDTASMLRNDPEQCILRLTASRSPGRATLDLTLRRGSRFVEGYLQSGSSATLAVYLQATETNSTATASAGYITATGNDAAGNRFACGSARTFSGHASGGVSKAATTTLDFWIGVAAGGGSAVSGDAATDLRNMYTACMPEAIYGVRR